MVNLAQYNPSASLQQRDGNAEVRLRTNLQSWKGICGAGIHHKLEGYACTGWGEKGLKELGLLKGKDEFSVDSFFGQNNGYILPTMYSNHPSRRAVDSVRTEVGFVPVSRESNQIRKFSCSSSKCSNITGSCQQKGSR